MTSSIVGQDARATGTPRRSLLFVPGSRPERFLKAESSGADMVCIDLEDAVAPADKAAAREAAMAHFGMGYSGVEQVLRINAVHSPEGEADLGALATALRWPDLVLLPKVEQADDVLAAARQLSVLGIGLVALIESPLGLLNLREIASSDPALVGLMFGGADYAAALGSNMDWDSLLYARSALVTVSAALGLFAIDVPCLALEDTQLLADETRRVKGLGFATKSAIHPAQVATIHEAFRPSAAETEAAQRIVQAAESSPGGVIRVDGRMVDQPVVLAAHRTLAIAALDT